MGSGAYAPSGSRAAPWPSSAMQPPHFRANVTPTMPTTETALPEPAVLRRIGRVRAVAARLEHAPQTLRALVRADELWLVLLAAMVDIAAGLAVVAMNEATQLAHVVLYGLQIGAAMASRVGRGVRLRRGDMRVLVGAGAAAAIAAALDTWRRDDFSTWSWAPL